MPHLRWWSIVVSHGGVRVVVMEGERERECVCVGGGDGTYALMSGTDIRSRNEA